MAHISHGGSDLVALKAHVAYLGRIRQVRRRRDVSLAVHREVEPGIFGQAVKAFDVYELVVVHIEIAPVTPIGIFTIEIYNRANVVVGGLVVGVVHRAQVHGLTTDRQVGIPMTGQCLNLSLRGRLCYSGIIVLRATAHRHNGEEQYCQCLYCLHHSKSFFVIIQTWFKLIFNTEVQRHRDYFSISQSLNLSISVSLCLCVYYFTTTFLPSLITTPLALAGSIWRPCRS